MFDLDIILGFDVPSNLGTIFAVQSEAFEEKFFLALSPSLAPILLALKLTLDLALSFPFE